MEWLQDQLLRLAARYYCQGIDVDAALLKIEKWDSESCKIKATDLKLTNEHGSLSVAECTVDVGDGWRIETQDTVTIAAPWKSIGAVMTDGWRGPAVSLEAAILEVRTGGAKLRIRNAGHGHGRGALEIHRRSDDERLAGPGRQPAGSHPRGSNGRR